MQGEVWRGLAFPSPEDLPNSGIKARLLHWQVDSLPLSHQGSPINGSRESIKYPWNMVAGQLLKLSLVMNWAGATMEDNTLADTVYQVF